MLTYPDIDRIALHLGPLKIYWYGVMYLVGFLLAWALAHYRLNRYGAPLSKEQIPDAIFYAALGVLAGGRIGYMLIYDFQGFLASPWGLFRVWDGGMSFHGGLIGVLISLWIYSRRVHVGFFEITDFFAPLVPLGLGAGRLGNFINGELVGRATDVPWGMVFPHIDTLPRHPSQLYELALEGLLLFICVWIYASKERPRMAVSAVFLIGYGIFRTFTELFRQPDLQIGWVMFDWLTMGQLLSIPMIIIGIMMLVRAYKKQ